MEKTIAFTKKQVFMNLKPFNHSNISDKKYYNANNNYYFK